jgi:plasmid stability protein
MANLTIVIDDGVLRRARIRALEQGTSVNAILRSYLETYAAVDAEREGAVGRMLEASRQATTGSGGRRWTRDELHER